MKNIRFYILSLFALVLLLSACGSDNDGDGGVANTNLNKNVPTAGMPKEVTRLEFPKVKGGTSIVLVHHANVPNKPGERQLRLGMGWGEESQPLDVLPDVRFQPRFQHLPL